MAVKKNAKKMGRLAVAKPVQGALASLPSGYAQLLEDLKGRIRRAQVRAAAAASRELVRLYWDIGREIVHRQERERWGKGVVDCLQPIFNEHFRALQGFSRETCGECELSIWPTPQRWQLCRRLRQNWNNPNLPQACGRNSLVP